MILSTPNLQISDETPFSGDLFDRRKLANSLTNIIKNCEDPLVIGIDGSWGEGKTTFVRMWQADLKKSNMPSIYIDAFSHDYTADAFMVVASSIYHYIKINTKGHIARNFLTKAKKAGSKLLPWGTKVAVKAATLGAIRNADIEDLGDIIVDLSSDVGDAAEKLIADKISSHQKDMKTLEAFKDFLSELPNSLTTEHSPLTIIIDELDRCRPSFAVEMLEKIKHLFSVPNVFFVLVINKTQLEESIKSLYGANIDAHTYLQKFITLETKIPKVGDRYGGDIRKYCEHLTKQHNLQNKTSVELTEYVIALGMHFDATLRQLERIYTNITLGLATYKHPSEEHHQLIAFAAAIKVLHPAVFSRLLTKNITFDELCSALKYKHTGEDEQRVVLKSIMEWVRYCVLTDSEYNDLKGDDAVKNMAKWQIGTRHSLLLRALSPVAIFY